MRIILATIAFVMLATPSWGEYKLPTKDTSYIALLCIVEINNSETSKDYFLLDKDQTSWWIFRYNKDKMVPMGESVAMWTPISVILYDYDISEIMYQIDRKTLKIKGSTGQYNGNCEQKNYEELLEIMENDLAEEMKDNLI